MIKVSRDLVGVISSFLVNTLLNFGAMGPVEVEI